MHRFPISLPRSVAAWAAILCLVVFTGCESSGGGGGGGDSPTEPEVTRVDFDGEVVRVDPQVDTLVLGSLRVSVDDDTVFDAQGDLDSVQAIRDALERGDVVRVEGRGVLEATNVVRAETLRAEVLGPTGDIQFVGRVVFLDRGTRQITLQSAIRLDVSVPPSTQFDAGGDLETFEEMADAFDRGDLMQVEGSGDLLNDGTARAREMRVEIVSDTNEPADFFGNVSSVDDLNQRLQLQNGTVVVIDGTTQFDSGGDLTSFGQISDAVRDGETVTVEGDGTRRGDGSIRAATIRAETDS